MSNHVIQHGLLFHGLVIAHAARIRFLAQMDSHVTLDVAADRSEIGARITHVLLLHGIVTWHFLARPTVRDQILDDSGIEFVAVDTRDVRVSKAHVHVFERG